MSAATVRAQAWRRDAAAVPFCAWPDRRVAAVGETLATTLRAWTEDWELSATVTEQVRCAAASEWACVGECGWLEVGGTAGAAAWLQWEPGQDTRIARSWFGDEARSSPVVSDVVDMCRQDLLRRTAGALRLGPAASSGPPDASSWGRWSGALVARLPACGWLLMQAGVVRAMARSRESHDRQDGPQSLVAVRDALRAATMPLQVELVGCELEVGELQALQIGDVVTLRHRTDAPALVCRPDGGVLLSGWLARTGGRKAIEFAPPPDKRATAKEPQ